MQRMDTDCKKIVAHVTSFVDVMSVGDLMEEICGRLEYDDAVRLSATCREFSQAMRDVLKRKLQDDVIFPASCDMLILRTRYGYDPNGLYNMQQSVKVANARRHDALMDLLLRRWCVFLIVRAFRVTFRDLLKDRLSYVYHAKNRVFYHQTLPHPLNRLRVLFAIAP